MATSSGNHANCTHGLGKQLGMHFSKSSLICLTSARVSNQQFLISNTEQFSHQKARGRRIPGTRQENNLFPIFPTLLQPIPSEHLTERFLLTRAVK